MSACTHIYMQAHTRTCTRTCTRTRTRTRARTHTRTRTRARTRTHTHTRTRTRTRARTHKHAHTHKRAHTHTHTHTHTNTNTRTQKHVKLDMVKNKTMYACMFACTSQYNTHLFFPTQVPIWNSYVHAVTATYVVDNINVYVCVRRCVYVICMPRHTYIHVMNTCIVAHTLYIGTYVQANNNKHKIYDRQAIVGFITLQSKSVPSWWHWTYDNINMYPHYDKLWWTARWGNVIGANRAMFGFSVNQGTVGVEPAWPFLAVEVPGRG